MIPVLIDKSNTLSCFSLKDLLDAIGIQVTAFYISFQNIQFCSFSSCIFGGGFAFFDLHIDNSTPDSHYHSRGFNIKRLIFIQLLLYIQQKTAFLQRQCKGITVLFELNTALLIHRHDLSGIQTDGCQAFFSGMHGFSAVETGVFHDKPGLAIFIFDFYRSLITKETHGRGGIALSCGDVLYCN